MHILSKMQEAMSGVRTELSAHAPRMVTIKIHPDKIREVIGKGGATIQALTKETGTSIDITDDGVVTIASTSAEGMEEAKRRIEGITAEAEVARSTKAQWLSCLSLVRLSTFFQAKMVCCIFQKSPMSV